MVCILLWGSPSDENEFPHIENEEYAVCVTVVYFRFASWSYHEFDVDLRIRPMKQLPDFQVTGLWNVSAAAKVRHVKVYACCAETFPDVTFSFRIQKRTDT